VSEKSEGAAPNEPRPQDQNEAYKKNMADGDVGQDDDGLKAANKTTEQLTSSPGFVAHPSRFISDLYWWKDNGIRLRAWQYIQHRRDYKTGRGCTDGIRSMARTLDCSRSWLAQILAELERDGHLTSEVYGKQRRRRTVVWPIGVRKPEKTKAKQANRPAQERTVEGNGRPEAKPSGAGPDRSKK